LDVFLAKELLHGIGQKQMVKHGDCHDSRVAEKFKGQRKRWGGKLDSGNTRIRVTLRQKSLNEESKKSILEKRRRNWTSSIPTYPFSGPLKAKQRGRRCLLDRGTNPDKFQPSAKFTIRSVSRPSGGGSKSATWSKIKERELSAVRNEELGNQNIGETKRTQKRRSLG